MKILAADNELPALNVLCRAIRDARPKAELRSFQRTSEIIEAVYEKGYRPDVAFLDIEMPGTTGLELAVMLKTVCKEVNIVFVTGYSTYALEALEQRASGYVLKPATREKIETELENLRHPPARETADKRVRIQCFGNFEVFLRGKPVAFSRAKSKEMLAYLVDRRGASCTLAEIGAILWEDGIYDRSRQKQLSVIRLDLLKSLQRAGIEEILIKARNALSVDPDAFDCDYYMALEGDSVAVNSFIGEYMMPYTWAEFTNGGLNSKFDIWRKSK